MPEEINHQRRRFLDTAAMAVGAAIAAGWGMNRLTTFTFANTGKAEGRWIGVLSPEKPGIRSARGQESQAAITNDSPSFDLEGAIGWLNSAPWSRKSPRGKVVLIDFWTYTCINSLRPLPYVKGWAAKYKDAGLGACPRIGVNGYKA